MAQETRELRAAIERERADLAGTIEALAYKADVVARLRASLDAGLEQLEDRAAALVHHFDGNRERFSTQPMRTPVERARQRRLVLIAAAAFVSGVLVARVLMRGR